MFSITVFHGAEHMTYKSNVAPIVGDIYTSGRIFDKEQFTVTKRLLSTIEDDVITVLVEYSYPKMVEARKLTDAERDLLTQENLS